jgi:hypothetical protein
MASVRKRTIPTERPPLVGEVSANFLQIDYFYYLPVASLHQPKPEADVSHLIPVAPCFPRPSNRYILTQS